MLTQNNTTQSPVLAHTSKTDRMLQDKFDKLTTKKLVEIPFELREVFVEYCQVRNVFPCGGLITDDNAIQYFYLD